MSHAVALLENIRSLHNVGSIFRTADGAGIQKIYLTGYTGTPPRSQIAKVSLGAEDTVPWEHNSDTAAQILALKTQGYKIVAIELTDTAENIFTYKWGSEPVCFVFGNEVEGVTPETLSLCDATLSLPMLGTKESLNVSVCAGIVFYEHLRAHK